MPIRATGIRLFISSTFSDFSRERQILDTQILPEIQRYCHERGFEFQPVDLRWGISDEIATSQRTLRVCLSEVTACVQTNLRPYFLILLGDRYGWRPLPEFIPHAEFELLMDWMANNRTEPTFSQATEALLRRWYRLDINHKPPRFVLQPRHRQRKTSRVDWKKLEQRLRVALESAAIGCGLSSEALQNYRLSATAQEIHRGVIAASKKERLDFNKHVLCFHRKRLGIPPRQPLDADATYCDVSADGTPDQDAAARLSELTHTLTAMLGDNMLAYQVFPEDHDSLRSYELTFEADVRRLLMSLIRAELPIQEQYRAAQVEWQLHADFGRERLHLMLGRDDLIAHVDHFLDTKGGRGLILHGKGGMGKSTLLAKAASMASDPNTRGMVTLQRYIGTTADSSTGHGLIVSLLHELESGTGASWTEHTDISALGKELRRLLARAAATTKRGVLLALDGLDQLDPDDPARSLEWLPWPAPEGLALIVSVLDGSAQRALMNRMVGASSLQVSGLAPKPGRDVLRSLLREADRSLQRSQEDYLLERFLVEGSPLFLRIAAELAKYWSAYEGAPVQTSAIPTSTPDLVQQFLVSLYTERGHEKLLVVKAFGLLMTSKRGLTEGELLALLWKDEALQANVRGKREHSAELSSLPMIYWSRLRDDLRTFLVERAADGTLLLAFFHRLFDEAAKLAFLPKATNRLSMHRAIAEHFKDEPTFLVERAGKGSLPNLRKVSELAFQLNRLDDAAGLFALLKTTKYFRAKLIAGLSDDLYLEFQQCARLMQVDKNPAKRVKLADVLVAHVITALEDDNASFPFSTLDLHNGLVYRDSGSFYAMFLGRCIAALRAHSMATRRRFRDTIVELAARLGNTRRRNGQLDIAERELSELLPRLHRLRLLSLASTAEYELGYVAFMRGQLTKASVLFERSARTAHQGGHFVSEWMSRCVSANVKWIDAISRHKHADEAPRFLGMLANAEAVFQSNVTSEGNALRWVYNVRHARFKVAFRMGDYGAAAGLAEQIRSDPWSRQYDQSGADSIIVNSRLAMMEGRMLDGAELLYKYASGLVATSEAKAEHYLDAGRAYWSGGKRTRASQVWHQGGKLEASHGNVPWQRLIAEAQEMASHPNT